MTPESTGVGQNILLSPHATQAAKEQGGRPCRLPFHITAETAPGAAASSERPCRLPRWGENHCSHRSLAAWMVNSFAGIFPPAPTLFPSVAQRSACGRRFRKSTAAASIAASVFTATTRPTYLADFQHGKRRRQNSASASRRGVVICAGGSAGHSPAVYLEDRFPRRHHRLGRADSKP
jgi:hypothetical protein